tara:strand:+ start:76 stop:312 length:237 start_codon:yes stop_codon:yes gene_type:complete
MSSWSPKEFKTRSLKGYKIAVLEELKDGDTYYLKDPFRSTMIKKMQCEHDFQKSLGVLSYYLRALEVQIEQGLIWVKE